MKHKTIEPHSSALRRILADVDIKYSFGHRFQVAALVKNRRLSVGFAEGYSYATYVIPHYIWEKAFE